MFLNAKLATVMSHEGSHYNGNRIEGLAHLAGAETYAFLNNKFTLQADKSFSMEMLSGIMNADNWKENTGDVDHWRIVSDNNGKIIDVKDDGDNSILTLVDEDGNIKSVTLNNGTSLSEQIAALSKTNQTKFDINGIMVDSGLHFDKNKGWYAIDLKGKYTGTFSYDDNVVIGNEKVYFSNNGYWEREDDIKQEDVEKQGELPIHSACAVTSASWVNNEFLKTLGIEIYDNDYIISNILDAKGVAFSENSYVNSWNLLMANYSANVNIDNYLLFSNQKFNSSEEVLQSGYNYYLVKYSHIDNPYRTHWVGYANGVKNDPDSTTKNRWWEKKSERNIEYYGLKPKFK